MADDGNRWGNLSGANGIMTHQTVVMSQEPVGEYTADCQCEMVFVTVRVEHVVGGYILDCSGKPRQVVTSLDQVMTVASGLLRTRLAEGLG